MMRLLVPISASLYHTNCLGFRWTQEHGCDSVVLVFVASGIGWATGCFLAGESLHGLLGYSVEVNIFQWPALRRQEFLSSHSRRSRLVMMRSVEHGCDSVVLVSVASGIGWATGHFSAGESLHGLLGYSVEVNIFQWPALRRQEFLSSHSRRSRLVMMRSVDSDEHGCDSVVLVSVASGIGWATGRFLAGESLHGLLGYSVEVNIFQWPALRRQEFVSSHSRRSRLVMMRSVDSDIRLSLSHQLGIGWATGRFLAGESLHGLLGYSVEVNIFQWPALKRQEFVSSHSRRSRLVMMRSVEHGCDSVVLVSVASGIGWATGCFLAGESLHSLLGYSVEVNMFRWPALKRQEFVSSHSRRSRLVMMRSVDSDIRLSLSHQLSGIPVVSRTWM
ncbi:hypothetical protein CLU79DRAFT_890868 [Phycomyces nitens]|nr:hypothetical protein CLU79DRAFT_890868 [Phycomyces nitens]